MDRTRTAVRIVAATQPAGSVASLPVTGSQPLSLTVEGQLIAFPTLDVPREFARYAEELLPQRPAGSSGKRGKCALTFHVRREKTHLQRSFVSHPFHITHPWYLDPALPDMAVVYVQTPAGGLIQGDRAAMQFTLESNARVHVTTQAAEKIHTMTANCAVQQVRFTLASHSYAEYCPEPIILFPQSRFAQDLQVELGESAWFFFTEIFLVPASMELFTAFANRLTVREASRKVLLHERGCVFPAQRGLDGPGILADHRVWGQGVFSGPQISSTQTKDLALLLTDQSDVTCGVTSLPYERGVAVKVVATNVPAVRQTLHAAWNFLRLQWLRAPAPQFPK